MQPLLRRSLPPARDQMAEQVVVEVAQEQELDWVPAVVVQWEHDQVRQAEQQVDDWVVHAEAEQRVKSRRQQRCVTAEAAERHAEESRGRMPWQWRRLPLPAKALTVVVVGQVLSRPVVVAEVVQRAEQAHATKARAMHLTELRVGLVVAEAEVELRQQVLVMVE